MTLESDLKKNALASMVNEAQMLQDHFKFLIDDPKLSQVRIQLQNFVNKCASPCVAPVCLPNAHLASAGWGMAVCSVVSSCCRCSASRRPSRFGAVSLSLIHI